MITMARGYRIIGLSEPRLLHERSDNKMIAFERANLLFVFNFHHSRSYSDYHIEAPPGKYQMILNSDDSQYGGHSRLKSDQYHFTIPNTSYSEPRHFISLYIPTRTALVLKSV